MTWCAKQMRLCRAEEVEGDLVDDGSDGVPGQKRLNSVNRVPEWVRHFVEASVPADVASGVEGLERELLVVQQPPGLCTTKRYEGGSCRRRELRVF